MAYRDWILVTAAFASEEHARRAIAFLRAHLEGRIVTTLTATDERQMAVVEVRVDRSLEARVETLLLGVHGILVEPPAEDASAIAS